MESPPLFVRLLSFLMLTTLCHAIAFTQSFNSSIQRCHDDESLALLQFKNSFNISSSCSYSKLESWKLNQGVRSGECCSWDGVECDEKTNHVVSLELNESCIYGSNNSNNTLFRLVHLQRLNLGSNDFIHSQIPSEIGQLSRLTHLDLSFSSFSGEIPVEISNLSSLVSLDLSRNLDFISYDGLLKLRKTSFRGLVQNMTNLKELDLEYVDISSTVPKVLANLSSLESLHLCGCELHGEFPASIENQLTGPIPPQINNLTSLSSLYLSSNKLQGSIPINFSRLNQLEFLDLHSNTLAGSLDLSSFFQLNQLTELILSFNSLSMHSTMATNGYLPYLRALGLAS
ncbi:receptor-like protein 7 [Manihot esculenta]|uniref:receptor-like protein 7 n=1 Tax=Manihot esculenta TaxID=3983 RepID=UPI001CC3D4BB|nr:receptor-like protein 7 [Manihot esculenta]